MFKLLIAAALAAVGVSQYSPPPSFGNMTNSSTFMNPIVPTGADP
ncbi:hypothetical protein AA0111_g10938 [Alternaria arborescens]|jgi:hypothetical protein|nr:hypothetical protein AA0111_g10938 [Alternaria arborescens]RYO18030.1 hypothetical protein AA0111_g10938 [Alternaria arborescens]